MSHSIDFVRDGELVPPALAALSTQERCSLIIDLGPSLWMVLRADLPAGLTLGLLTGAPKAGQENDEEFAADGYVRQPLNLASVDDARSVQAKRTVVSFGPLSATAPTASYAAIFDADGYLLYFGSVDWKDSAASVGAVPHWLEFRRSISAH